MSNEANNSGSSRWSRISSAALRAYHAYAGWLVGISWWRFFGLSLLLIIAMGILHDVPPLSWTYSETLSESGSSHTSKSVHLPRPTAGKKHSTDGVDISIDERGVHISTRSAAPAPAASAASSPVAPASTSGVTISLPPGADAQTVKEAVDEARRELIDALEEARQEAQDAAEAAADARHPSPRA